MNNEEKILSLLEKMDTRQTQSEQILAQLTSDMSDMKARQAKTEITPVSYTHLWRIAYNGGCPITA